jgi:hypothetical protein
VSLAEVRGADRIAIGLVEELLIERSASRSGSSAPVLGVRPRDVGSDAARERAGTVI